MYLKSLNLINFQKHSDLTLDFTEGVNIIYGSSDAGKSCIRRAIAWLYDLETYNEETIRKEGSKKTSVKGLFDNGIEIERIRSSSINRYVTTVNGKVNEYDSVGKGAPAEVRELINMSLVEIDDKIKLNLNISEQVSLPFLQDIPASSRLKLFNKLTGNDLLDSVVQNFNKEIINIRRSLTIEENLIKENEPKIEALNNTIKSKKISADFIVEKLKTIGDNYRKLTELKKIQVNLYAIKMSIKAYINDLNNLKLGDEVKIACLKEQNTTLEALSLLKQTLYFCKNSLSLTKNDLERIKTPDFDIQTHRAKIDTLNRLKQAQNGLKTNKEELERILGQIRDLKLTEANGAPIKANIEKFLSLRKLSEHFIEIKGKIEVNTKELNDLFNIIPKQEQEYASILKEAGICPVCKQDTSKCEINL